MHLDMDHAVNANVTKDILALYAISLRIVLLGQAIKNVKTEHLLENISAVVANAKMAL